MTRNKMFSDFIFFLYQGPFVLLNLKLFVLSVDNIPFCCSLPVIPSVIALGVSH